MWVSGQAHLFNIVFPDDIVVEGAVDDREFMRADPGVCGLLVCCHHSVNPSVPDVPNWRISAFEKKLCETEWSNNVVHNVKRSGRGFSIINRSCKFCQITRTMSIQKSLCHDFLHFSQFSTLSADCARLRDRRMSCIVSKGRADFSTLTADCARLRGHRILKIVSKRSANVT